MTDDKEILELTEELASDLDSMELLNQSQNLVIYSVQDLYYENGELRKSSEIKKAPPTLLIQAYESEAEFLLTEDTVDSLIESLTLVKKAYYGIDGRNKEPWGWKRVKEGILKNPVGFIFILLAIVLVLLNVLKIA